MSIKEAAAKIGRIHELDLLRGFFILVILIDHFQRWPSPFTFLTGEGRLWVSAAEGFFIISGLLIGYLRGYKSRHHPLKDIAKKLLKRAAMLYVWCVVITFFVVGVMVFFTNGTDALYPLLPKFPEAAQLSDLPTYVWSVISGQYATDWIYFLRLYAIILAVSPLVVWLFRKGLWWVVMLLTWAVYGLSFLLTPPEAAMQWQFLFFNAAVIGWKLESIILWLREHPLAKKIISISLVSVTFFTMIISYLLVVSWNKSGIAESLFTTDSYNTIRAATDPIFTNNPMSIGRMLLSFVWFGGLMVIFHHFKAFIMKWFGWLLMPFGTASLNAYCLQAILFVFIQAAIPVSQSGIVNMLSTIVVVLIIWGILKIPLAQRVLPR